MDLYAVACLRASAGVDCGLVARYPHTANPRRPAGKRRNYLPVPMTSMRRPDSRPCPPQQLTMPQHHFLFSPQVRPGEGRQARRAPHPPVEQEEVGHTGSVLGEKYLSYG